MPAINASTTLRSIDQWEVAFERLDATTVSAELAVADRILADLIGYRHSSKHRSADAQQLANAMQAYARLLQKHGVTIP